MPTLEFREVDGKRDVYCDRDSTSHHYPTHMRQGMYLHLDGLTLHFDDEEICLILARKIADRLGYEVIGKGEKK